MDASIRDTIAKVAQEEGLDPSYALAVAERESDFNPNAGGKGTIRGLFQMTRRARRDAGQSDNASIEDQVRGFARYTKGVQGEMQRVLGRAPTPDETYLGHFIGGPRAARVISGAHAGMAPADLFSRRELADNPQIAKAASAGHLAQSVIADIGKRRAKFGGETSPLYGNDAGLDFSIYGKPTAGGPTDKVASNEADFAQFGQPTDATMSKSETDQSGGKIDFAEFGQPDSPAQRNFERNKAWTKPDAQNFSTDLGNAEPQFRQWVKDKKVPFDPDAKEPQDYDMRGFYRGLQSGDPKAKSAIDPNDGKLHYPDNWKTPYHDTFSNDSQWAAPNAPKWNGKDQLIGPDGAVIFDDRAKKPPGPGSSNERPGKEIDLTQFGIGAQPVSMPVTGSPDAPLDPWGKKRAPKSDTPGPADMLQDLDDEMAVRLNAPDPDDFSFQNTVRSLQPDPQRI